MPQAATAREWFTAGGERRRIPRYSCNGLAQITSLPLSGSPLRGRVRDLGLGGCCIECSESVPWIELGDRTEILLEVNSWFVRATAHVKAIRGQVALSMQFLRMSAGGSSMLADLIADLERPRIVESRPACLVERPPQLLRGGSNSSLLSARPEGVAIGGTILPPYPPDEIYPATSRDAGIRNLYPANPSVDLFV